MEEPEQPTEASIPIVLISRTGLHVIVAVLGIAILGCVCALAYSFGNYSKLKKNVEQARSYIASRHIKLGADHGSGEHSTPGDVGMGKGRSTTSKTPVPAAVPRDEARVDKGRKRDEAQRDQLISASGNAREPRKEASGMVAGE